MSTIIVGDIAEGTKWWGTAEFLKQQLVANHRANNSFMEAWKQVSSTVKIFVKMVAGQPQAVIYSSGGPSIFLAPQEFQVPDGFVGTDPYSVLVGDASPNGDWNAATVVGTAGRFRALFPGWEFGNWSDTRIQQFSFYARSTVERARQIVPTKTSTTYIFEDKPSDVFGSRGYGSAPYNSLWLNEQNRLPINASLREFKNKDEFKSVLPAGDMRTKNFYPFSFLAFTSGGPVDILEDVPVAVGVYIDNIFYVMPSLLTSQVQIAPELAIVPLYHVAARPTAITVLTAVCTDPIHVGGSSFGSTSRYGPTGIIIGYSRIVHPTISETTIMANSNTHTHKLRGTLEVLGTVYIDQNEGIGGKSTIAWMEFSPDCNFLYIGMFHSIDMGEVDPRFVKFYIRRVNVFNSGSGVYSVGSPITIVDGLTITTSLGAPIKSDRIVGGFRCQVISPGVHRVGFLRSNVVVVTPAVSSTYDLRAIKYDVLANVNAPYTLGITSTELNILDAPVKSGVLPEWYHIYRIGFTDFKDDLYFYNEPDQSGGFAPGMIYMGGIIIYHDQVFLVNEAAGPTTISQFDYFGGGYKFIPATCSPMLDSTRGNTYAELEGLIYCQTVNNGLIAVSRDTGAFQFVPVKAHLESRYIVCSG